MAKTKPIVRDIAQINFTIPNEYKKAVEVNSKVSADEISILVKLSNLSSYPNELALFRNGKLFKPFQKDPHNNHFDVKYPISSQDFGKYLLEIATPNGAEIAQKWSDLEYEIVPRNEATIVRLARPGFEDTIDRELWDAIKANSLKFKEYAVFITKILCAEDNTISYNDTTFSSTKRKDAKKRSPFIGVKEYNLLKFGTEFYMLSRSSLGAEEIQSYLGTESTLPYFGNISDSLEDIRNEYGNGECAQVENERLRTPFFIELIWSYWMEQGMLMQAMNLITLRFQNIDNGNMGQLGRFDLSPLRPLSHILWGYIQDEQHRLSLPRRLREYDHEYGLTLSGRAVPAITPADSRLKFLEAFHNLLTTSSIFFKEADDTTRIADAFPVLNSLKEVHLLLAEGNHNAYGNLTWTTRHEMLMTQYIISREETRVFLGGRPMVPYPEQWMDRVDTIRNMMGWGSTSITYFYDLAIHGEKVLLAIRYGNWSDANMPVAAAANWAMAFRDSIQKYIHGYRTVTGVDLSADSTRSGVTRTIQPSVLIQRRIGDERLRQRRA